MPSFLGRIKDRQIILWVHVAKPNLDSDSIGSEAIAFEALVDTGATISGMSPKVIESLGLKPDGWQSVTGVHGTADTPTYAVSIAVPISEEVSGPDGGATKTFSRGANLEVALLQPQPNTFDVLLGMDLLENFHLTIHKDLFILSN